MKGFVRKFKPLENLTEEQIQSIHQGTLQVLERTGKLQGELFPQLINTANSWSWLELRNLVCL